MKKFTQSRHSQKLGTRLKEKKGTEFFRDMNPNKKLSEKKVKSLLADFYGRPENNLTIPLIAKKYSITKSNVYYHARKNNRV